MKASSSHLRTTYLQCRVKASFFIVVTTAPLLGTATGNPFAGFLYEVHTLKSVIGTLRIMGELPPRLLTTAPITG
jgi:hypothetical protein